MRQFDVTVIGGGPGGLAAAASASREGAKTLLIEREARLGGVLKQCIHDGFGVVRYKEKLSGYEYAQRLMEELAETEAESRCTPSSKMEKTEKGFELLYNQPRGDGAE